MEVIIVGAILLVHGFCFFKLFPIGCVWLNTGVHPLLPALLFQVMKESASELTARPENGCYIRGLFLEGARWDPEAFVLAESRPKELYTDMSVMWLIPMANRKQPETGMYMCPVYKTLTRAGTCVHFSVLSALTAIDLNTIHPIAPV